MVIHEYRRIFFREAGCSVRSLESDKDRIESSRLRHRVFPSDHRFMLQSAFADLIAPGYRVRKAPDTVEISRLAVAPDAQSSDPSRGGDFGLGGVSRAERDSTAGLLGVDVYNAINR